MLLVRDEVGPVTGCVDGVAAARPLPRPRAAKPRTPAMALEAANWDQGMALINDYMLQPEDPRLVRLPLHALETGDNFYFVCKRSRAHEPAISRLRQWLWQESQASLRPGENELLRRV